MFPIIRIQQLYNEYLKTLDALKNKIINNKLLPEFSCTFLLDSLNKTATCRNLDMTNHFNS